MMSFDPSSVSQLLFASLLRSPLLVGDLPEASSLSRGLLDEGGGGVELNLEQKLGHLYEDALGALLEESEAVDLLEKNLQIQSDAQRTVGELDYLLRERGRDGLVHLELAVKFYLAVENDVGMAFPGPDARDNYARKLKRLREHQLGLSENYRELFPEIYRGEVIRTEQLIYGCLFDHILAEELSQPEFVTPDCRRGLWLHEREVPSYVPPGSHLRVIPKVFWPVPLEFLRELALEEWRKDEPLERCVMVRIEGDERPHFIVPDGYPDRLGASD